MSRSVSDELRRPMASVQYGHTYPHEASADTALSADIWVLRPPGGGGGGLEGPPLSLVGGVVSAGRRRESRRSRSGWGCSEPAYPSSTAWPSRTPPSLTLTARCCPSHANLTVAFRQSGCLHPFCLQYCRKCLRWHQYSRVDQSSSAWLDGHFKNGASMTSLTV